MNNLKIKTTVFILLFPILLIAQYRDTLRSTSFTNGQSIKKAMIHNRTFPISDENQIETIFKSNKNEFSYKFPNNLKKGVDSVFLKSKEYGDSTFLLRLIELFDNKGSAKITTYFFNGEIHHIENFVSGELDTVYREMVSTIYPGNDISYDSAYTDTLYQYKAIPHGKFIIYHDNGQLEYEANIDLGKMDGDVETFHKNGNLRSKERFERGNLIDTLTSYYENKQMEAQIIYKNYLPNGQYRIWFKNGNLKVEGQLVYGKFNGAVKGYHENGKLKSIVRWKIEENPIPIELLKKRLYEENQEFIKSGGKVIGYDGTKRDSNFITRSAYRDKYSNEKHGKSEFWNDKGEKILEEEFLMGESISKKEFKDINEVDHFFEKKEKENCEKKIELQLFDDEGLGGFKREFCTKNVLGFRIDTFYVDYQKNLLDSIVKVKEIVRFDSPNGKCKYQRFYSNNQIKMEAYFQDSDFLINRDEGYSTVKKIGLWKYWYPNGVLKWEKKWDNLTNSFLPSMEKTYFENGQIASEEYHVENGEEGTIHSIKTYRKWFENGQLKEEVEHAPNGGKEGHSKLWNKQGQLLKHENYLNNKLHGKQKYFDENGKLIKQEKYRKGRLISSK